MKVILELSDDAINKATELFDWLFSSDESCSDGSLPASKEWSEFLSAWADRQIEPEGRK